MKQTTISLLVVSIFLASFVYAVGLGVSPSDLIFKDVLKGSTYEKEFKIDNTADKDIIATIEIEGNEDWFTFIPRMNVTVPSKGNTQVKVKIDIPKDTPNGVYETKLRVAGKPLTMKEGTVGLIPGVAFKSTITVTNKEIVEGYVDNIRTRDGNETVNPKFLITFLNKGNVEVQPLVEITVNGETIKRKLEQLKPWESKAFEIEYEEELERGYHAAQVKVLLGRKVITEKDVGFSVFKEPTAQKTTKTKKQPSTNTLIGVGIIAAILIIGLILYYAISKKSGLKTRK